LDRELADMDTYTPHYSAMARGHGSGGPALMRAEALLCRGETEEAEIYGHQARHEAASHRQSSILIGAELFFGRLAVLRGDGAGFAAALQNMAGQVKENPQKSNRMEADMARSWLMGLLERPQDMVPWLRAGLDFSRRLFTQAIPCAHICRAHCLLLEKQPAILLGQAEAALGLAQALGYSLALLYGYLQIAAARCMQGRPKEARAGLEKAQALALPDRLLLPMAEYYPLLGPLLEKASPEVLEALQALAFRLQAGRQAVLRHLYKTKFPSGLSEREGQTARLAAQGLSNREIAQRLCVTEHTVKKHLKAVVRKSGATRATFYRLFSDLQRPEA
jgi:LuxR family maltose regulon positive regulatory protein